MVVQWRPFRISLLHLKQHLDTNHPLTSGIVASSINFQIIEKMPLSEMEKTIIQTYIDSLTEPEELQKLTYKARLTAAVNTLREGLLHTDLNVLTLVQKKVLMGIPLTDDEAEIVLEQYGET